MEQLERKLDQAASSAISVPLAPAPASAPAAAPADFEAKRQHDSSMQQMQMQMQMLQLTAALTPQKEDPTKALQPPPPPPVDPTVPPDWFMNWETAKATSVEHQLLSFAEAVGHGQAGSPEQQVLMHAPGTRIGTRRSALD